MTKKILYITGSRADFGRIMSTLHLLKKKSISVQLLITGQHFSKKHGYTVNEVKKEKFETIFEADTYVDGNDPYHMVQMLSKTIQSINNILKNNNIDLILLLGDRGEMLAGAISAAHHNIPIAHIAGGQHSGSIDDSIRDAITMFANIHFVATKKNKQRIMQLKEDNNEIYIVGAPDIDMIQTIKFRDKKTIKQKYNLDVSKPVFLLVQHPVTNEITQAKKQILNTLKALRFFDAEIICILPNADAGGKNIREEIIKEKHPNLHIFSHIPYKDFLEIMNIADVLIGNSSAGVIESASFHLPTVNIGTRQQKREQSKNVINIDHDKDKIIKAIQTCLSSEFKQKLTNIKNIYGDGKTGEKIAKILKQKLEGESL